MVRRCQMPVYEFNCPKCEKEFSVALTVKDLEEGKAKCPDCDGSDVKQLVNSFTSKTSRKS
jgi:putative FmdB family regulatory protein